MKKEQPTAYEIEAAALLSLLWCRLLRTPSDDAKWQAAARLDRSRIFSIQRDMVSYIYSHYSESINLDEIAAAGKVCRNKCCQIFRRYLNQSPIDFLNHYRLEVSCHLLNTYRNCPSRKFVLHAASIIRATIPKSSFVPTAAAPGISENAQKRKHQPKLPKKTDFSSISHDSAQLPRFLVKADIRNPLRYLLITE